MDFLAFLIMFRRCSKPCVYAVHPNVWNGVDSIKRIFFFKVLLYFFFLIFIYFWLCWVFVSVRGLSLVAASGGHSSSRCAGLSLSRPLLLQSTGSSRAGSVVVAHGPSRSAACGIFPDQGSNPFSLHWQADSQPLRHQGSPRKRILKDRLSSKKTKKKKSFSKTPSLLSEFSWNILTARQPHVKL